jgi:hypothetical protein
VRSARNPQTAFNDLLSGLVRGGDLAAIKRAVLSGQLHLQSPVRIGDLLISVDPSADDPNRLDLNVQNARTMGEKITIVSVP